MKIVAKASILQKLIDDLDISTRKFEINIGAGASSIDKAIKRDTRISRDIVYKIKTRYPQVNERWLSTGEGEMYADYGEEETVQPVNRLDHLYQLAKRGKMHDNDMQEAFVLLLEDLINKKAP
jgi:hypothetical protein